MPPVYEGSGSPPMSASVAGRDAGLCRYRKREVRRNLSGKRRRCLNPPRPSSLSEAIARGLSPSTGQRRPSLARNGGRESRLIFSKMRPGGCGEKNPVESMAAKIVENA